MRNQAILALTLVIAAQSANAQNSSVCQYPKEAFGIMKNTASGKEVYYPITYHLHRLDVGDVRTYDDTDKLANLQLSDGVTPVMLLYGNHGALKDLTVESAKKIFGEPSFRGQSERVPTEELVTFNLKGFGPVNEPNIFHIDIETGADGKFKSYRVRGNGIPKPEWQELNSKELSSK